MTQNVIAEALDRMANEVRTLLIEKGWRNPDGSSDKSFGEEIALIHSELSEALEAFREHGTKDAFDVDTTDVAGLKPEGVGSELADVLIRLVDLADSRGINLAAEYHRKMAFNHTRAWRHGGKGL